MIHGKENTAIAAIALLAFMSLPAIAQIEKGNSAARFSIIETADGFLRLDQQNGNISICKAKNDQMICKLGADERRAYEREIEQINKRLDKLTVRLNSLESTGGGAVKSPDAPNSTENKSTREEEFERALKFADRAFRQFFGMIQELKKEEKEEKKDAI